MNDTSAYSVKFDKEVGGNKGFTSFVEYAESKGIGVFPDFDFANIGKFKLFDGVSMRKHLIKTMDNRYTTKRYYDSTLQSFAATHWRSPRPFTATSTIISLKRTRS